MSTNLVLRSDKGIELSHDEMDENWEWLEKGFWVGTVNPTINDDSTLAFHVNSVWLNITNNRFFKCLDSSIGGAVWEILEIAVPPLTQFIEMLDTPSSFVAEKWLKVNDAGTALVWTDPPTVGGGFEHDNFFSEKTFDYVPVEGGTHINFGMNVSFNSDKYMIGREYGIDIINVADGSLHFTMPDPYWLTHMNFSREAVLTEDYFVVSDQYEDGTYTNVIVAQYDLQTKAFIRKLEDMVTLDYEGLGYQRLRKVPYTNLLLMFGNIVDLSDGSSQAVPKYWANPAGDVRHLFASSLFVVSVEEFIDYEGISDFNYYYTGEINLLNIADLSKVATLYSYADEIGNENSTGGWLDISVNNDFILITVSTTLIKVYSTAGVFLYDITPKDQIRNARFLGNTNRFVARTIGKEILHYWVTVTEAGFEFSYVDDTFTVAWTNLNTDQTGDYYAISGTDEVRLMKIITAEYLPEGTIVDIADRYPENPLIGEYVWNSITQNSEWWNGTAWTGSFNTYLQLNDTPISFTGDADKILAVNVSEDGVYHATKSQLGLIELTEDKSVLHTVVEADTPTSEARFGEGVTGDGTTMAIFADGANNIEFIDIGSLASHAIISNTSEDARMDFGVGIFVHGNRTLGVAELYTSTGTLITALANNAESNFGRGVSADSNLVAVKSYSSVRLFDGTGAFIKSYANSSTTEGVALKGNKLVYIAGNSSTRTAVVRNTDTDVILASIGNTPFTDFSLFGDQIDIDDTYVYISETSYNAYDGRVDQYEHDGTFVRTYLPPDGVFNSFGSSVSVFNNVLCISARGNNRVFMYDTLTGALLDTFNENNATDKETHFSNGKLVIGDSLYDGSGGSNSGKVTVYNYGEFVFADYLGGLPASAYALAGESGGATTFLQLTDTPSAYTASKILKTDITGSFLEEVDHSFLTLEDTPSAYTGLAGQAVVVNATEDGLETAVPAGGGGVEYAFERDIVYDYELLFATYGGEQNGYSIALQGGLAIIGAPDSDETATNAGHVDLVDLPSKTRILKLERAGTTNFGRSVAVDNDFIVVGSNGQAFIFDIDGTFVAELPNTGALTQFGYNCDIKGDVIVIGSYEGGCAQYTTAGTYVRKLTHSTNTGRYFNCSISDDKIAISCYWNIKRCTVFDHSGVEQYFVDTTTTGVDTDRNFGRSCQITDKYLMVGSAQANLDTHSAGSLFDVDGTHIQEFYPLASWALSSYEEFGWEAMIVNDNMVIISGRGHINSKTSSNGNLAVYQIDESLLFYKDDGVGAQWGGSIAYDNGHIIIGHCSYPTNNDKGRFSFWRMEFGIGNNYITNQEVHTYGKTVSRPLNPKAGAYFFDTDLGYPIWYNGGMWTNHLGVKV